METKVMNQENIEQQTARQIKTLVQDMIRQHKKISYAEIVAALLHLGFSKHDVISSLSEINYQLSWLGKTTNKLSHLREDWQMQRVVKKYFQQATTDDTLTAATSYEK